jgi:hypothetical protein
MLHTKYEDARSVHFLLQYFPFRIDRERVKGPRNQRKALHIVSLFLPLFLSRNRFQFSSFQDRIRRDREYTTHFQPHDNILLRVCIFLSSSSSSHFLNGVFHSSSALHGHLREDTNNFNTSNHHESFSLFRLSNSSGDNHTIPSSSIVS